MSFQEAFHSKTVKFKLNCSIFFVLLKLLKFYHNFAICFSRLKSDFYFQHILKAGISTILPDHCLKKFQAQRTGSTAT